MTAVITLALIDMKPLYRKRHAIYHILRISFGFIGTTCLLLLAGQISVFSAMLIMVVGIFIGFVLAENELQIIQLMKDYFASRMQAGESGSAPRLSVQHTFDEKSPISELFWLVSVSEDKNDKRFKKLQTESHYLNETIRNLPFPLILLDKRGYVIEYNMQATQLFGSIQMHKPVAFFIHDNEAIERIEAVTKGERHHDVVELVRRENKDQIFELLISNFSADDNLQTALILMDRSEAKIAETMRVDFVANVSHELRTPLTSVLGFVETLRGPAGEDKATRDKFLAIVESQSARMVRLVSDQLSLSSIERQESKQPSTIISLIQLAERVAELLSGQAKEQGTKIRIIKPAEEVKIIGDGDEITQMLQNLVENAIRYGQHSAEVRIIITAEEQHPVSDQQNTAFASIAVEDEGDGIDSSHIPRLTERFYRIDKGRSRDNGGTGLGLAIVKHIVNRHRGHLVITSKIGTGSRFCVLLPKPAS